MTTLAEVDALYGRWGHDAYDELVSQLDHALQCAALARRDGAGDALVAAALLHDVGHLLDLDAAGGYRPAANDLRHEVTGARWLAGCFPGSVTAPVALHVAAKRALCATDPGYAAALSGASRRSLAFQGGPMTPAELAGFAAEPGHADALALRRWDDTGKVPGLAVAPWSSYQALLGRLARVPAEE